jgi:uncharacterized protein (TIGR00369 family)
VRKMGERNGRSRTVVWEDPMAGVGAANELSGLEYLRTIARGELPAAPMADLMGFDFYEIEEGRVVFECVPAEYHYNPIGAVHGGFACTLVDSAMGCAVHTMLPAGVGYTTLEIKTNLLRPITAETGRLLCEGKAIHVGGRVATAEARLTDEGGKLYAHATTTCMVFRDGTGERSVGEGHQ